ncbi:hypothetical protein CNQ87_08675 [Lysinibacillus fusiformis]|nr:hypothetical protein CNQ87_08675 [Lysinibacillus fusiformis]
MHGEKLLLKLHVRDLTCKNADYIGHNHRTPLNIAGKLQSSQLKNIIHTKIVLPLNFMEIKNMT